jgi:hypothetical protein
LIGLNRIPCPNSKVFWGLSGRRQVWAPLTRSSSTFGYRPSQGDNVVGFAFKRMPVKTPSLYGRKRLKVAADGEVSNMATPFEFRVLEGRLKLLASGKERSEPRSSIDDAETA